MDKPQGFKFWKAGEKAQRRLNGARGRSLSVGLSLSRISLLGQCLDLNSTKQYHFKLNYSVLLQLNPVRRQSETYGLGTRKAKQTSRDLLVPGPLVLVTPALMSCDQVAVAKQCEWKRARRDSGEHTRRLAQ